MAAHGGRAKPQPGGGWVLACLYPAAVVVVVLFIAYPIIELLLRAVLIDGRLSFAPLAKVLDESYNRQAIYNTLLLGLTVAVLGTVLAAEESIRYGGRRSLGQLADRWSNRTILSSICMAFDLSNPLDRIANSAHVRAFFSQTQPASAETPSSVPVFARTLIPWSLSSSVPTPPVARPLRRALYQSCSSADSINNARPAAEILFS